MPVRTDDARFMYFGTSEKNFTLALPFPTWGSAAFETERTVDAARNANNVVVGQMVGRSIDKQKMKWENMPREKWWEINRWLETNGMFFWCRYFSHNSGEWKVRRFYCGNIKCEPAYVDPDTGMPAFYSSAEFNVVDTGA